MLPPTPTQLYFVSIRFRRKISFVTSFTISNWLKKYYLDEEDDWRPGKPLDQHEDDIEGVEGEVKKSLIRRGEKGSESSSINKGVADQYKVEGGWICK